MLISVIPQSGCMCSLVLFIMTLWRDTTVAHHQLIQAIPLKTLWLDLNAMNNKLAPSPVQSHWVGSMEVCILECAFFLVALTSDSKISVVHVLICREQYLVCHNDCIPCGPTHISCKRRYLNFPWTVCFTYSLSSSQGWKPEEKRAFHTLHVQHQLRFYLKQV